MLVCGAVTGVARQVHENAHELHLLCSQALRSVPQQTKLPPLLSEVDKVVHGEVAYRPTVEVETGGVGPLVLHHLYLLDVRQCLHRALEVESFGVPRHLVQQQQR